MLDTSSLKHERNDAPSKRRVLNGNKNVQRKANDKLSDKMKLSYSEPEVDIIKSGIMTIDNNQNDLSESSLSEIERSPTCTSSNDKVKNKNTLTISSIGHVLVEFDRSDLSSDSEPERTRRTSLHRKISKTRRARFSLDERTRRIPENEVIKKENNASRIPRRRRSGVSGEPMRTTWSTSRESHDSPRSLNKKNDTYASGNDKNGSHRGSTGRQENVAQTIVSESLMEVRTDVLNQNSPPVIINGDGLTHKTLTSASSKSSVEITSEKWMTNSKKKDCGDSRKDDVKTISTSYHHIDQQLTEQSRMIPVDDIKQRIEYFVPATPSWNKLEKKYKTLVISFQTDQYTLTRRLESQERARDVAESGMERELQKLSSAIRDLENLRQTTPAFKEICSSFGDQVDVLRKGAMKVSAQAEQHGCYQQEKATAPNIEVMIAYVENLRKHIDKLEDELKRVKSSEVDESNEHQINGLTKRNLLQLSSKEPDLITDTQKNLDMQNGKQRNLGEFKKRRLTPYVDLSSDVAMEEFQRKLRGDIERKKRVSFFNDMRMEKVYSIRDSTKISRCTFLGFLSRNNKFYVLFLTVTSIIMFLVGSYIELIGKEIT